MSGKQNIDAISAIKAQISSMSEVEKQQFKKETGFDISSINIMSYEAAEKYCKNHNINLSTTNVWADYNQAKAAWNTYHDLYIQANARYDILNSEKNTAHVNYDKLYLLAVQENGGEKLNTAEDNAIRRKTNYTTETITNARQAEHTANDLLDNCYIAVNNQRAALNKGIIAEGLMNFKA